MVRKDYVRANAVAFSNEYSWCNPPSTAWVIGDIDVLDSALAQFHEHEYIKDTESGCDHERKSRRLLSHGPDFVRRSASVGLNLDLGVDTGRSTCRWCEARLGCLASISTCWRCVPVPKSGSPCWSELPTPELTEPRCHRISVSGPGPAHWASRTTGLGSSSTSEWNHLLGEL